MTTWVVVPCAVGRADEFYRLIGGLGHPLDRTLVVTTLPAPFGRVGRMPVPWITLSACPDHFSCWLNCAFDWLERTRATEALVIGSSLTCEYRGAPERLASAMREHGLAMIGPDFHGRTATGEVWRFTAATPRTAHDRVSPHAFMVDLTLGLRADPQFRWWYSDDDLEEQARQVADVAVLGGTGIRHDSHHGLTPERHAWAIEDHGRFVRKWGRQPS